MIAATAVNVTLRGWSQQRHEAAGAVHVRNVMHQFERGTAALTVSWCLF
jgi:hypothetical protein